MKQRTIIALPSALAILILATSIVLPRTLRVAQSAVDWWVVAGGGGPSTAGGGSVELNATLGQPVVGPAGSGQLSLGAGYWYGAAPATLPPTVDFSSATYEVNEDVGTATITVTLDAPSCLTVTVNYALTNDTPLLCQSLSSSSGTLTFTLGVTSQTFNVLIVDDTTDEDDETVNLTLSDPVNASLGPNNLATLIIRDDDPSPTVDFSSATYSVNEGDGPATITVTLDAPSCLTVTVDYATSDGTATAGADYTATSGTLTFAPGVISQTFDAPTIDDALNEGDETVMLTLSNASNATLGGVNPATLTIDDDEGQPSVQFSMAAYTISETGGTATITVTLSTPSALVVTVDYATSNGTATAGLDYTAASDTLTFDPGVTSRTFAVAITDDALCEEDETVFLTLSNASNATISGTNPAILTIVDNEHCLYLPLVMKNFYP